MPTFLLLVLALSLPFWLLGALTGLELVQGLPVAALMAFCPYHTTDNVSWLIFPNLGSHFDPRTTGLITAAVAIVVVLAWGARTLTRQRAA